MSIDEYLKSFVTEGVSDIHFKVSRPPLKRIHGKLFPVEKKQPLTPRDTEELAMHLLGTDMWQRFLDRSEIDTSYSIPGFTRFRVSCFRQRGSVSLAMRIIPYAIPTLDELKVPKVVKYIANSPRGLVLVTGVTGAGKSSTLAGMIEHINAQKECHIITIEDPIEFLHSDKVASINQREVGIDTQDFTTAFRAALRQDPDVILVGELRDAETMETALRAAETGHLVLATVHTTDAKETIGRFIDSFPPHQHKQMRLQLAANLRGVISQRLLQRADGKGLVLAAEIMIVTAAIRDFIVNPEKTNQIPQNIDKSRERHGMQTFDQAIMDLLQDGVVTEDEAIRNATSPNDLRVKLNLGVKKSGDEAPEEKKPRFKSVEPKKPTPPPFKSVGPRKPASELEPKPVRKAAEPVAVDDDVVDLGNL